MGPEEKWLSRFGCNYPWSRDTSVAWYIKSCLTSIPNVRRGLAKSHYLPNIGFTSGKVWLDVFFENRVVMINPVREHPNRKVRKTRCTVCQLTPILEPSTRLVKEQLNFHQEKSSKRTLTFDLYESLHMYDVWFIQVINSSVFVYMLFMFYSILQNKKVKSTPTVSPCFDRYSWSIIPQLFTSHKRGCKKNGLGLSKAIERVRAALQVISTYLWVLMSSCVILGGGFLLKSSILVAWCNLEARKV